jgi:threonylcarbamoyladenosine tRNA methylthiotransferase MtaB
VKIQDGCDYVCSFCIIPTARGRNRSIPFEEVVATIRRYGELGAREVVLTGIHVGHFGRDLSPRRSLLDLLREIEAQRLVPRVRISSIEPNELRIETLDFAAASETVCPHFHVPLQSGSDALLRRMRRVYTTQTYAALMEAVRARLPRAAIGIDVIVGFPGETREQFQETYRFLRGLDFTYLHVFPYSPRAGTEAAALPDHVPPEEKKERSELLRALSDERRAAFQEAQVGTEVLLLVEGRRGRGQRLRGTSENYVTVEIDSREDLTDQIVPVRLLRAEGAAVFGEVTRGGGA